MKVFRPSDLIHNLQVIPRRYITGEAVLLIRNEVEDITDEVTINCSTDNGYLVADFEYAFKEGFSYEYEIQDQDGTIRKDKIYATDQTDLQNYKLTNGTT